ncbi:hypothetical protein ACOMHN_013784 [Nucella lapillus]
MPKILDQQHNSPPPPPPLPTLSSLQHLPPPPTPPLHKLWQVSTPPYPTIETWIPLRIVEAARYEQFDEINRIFRENTGPPIRLSEDDENLLLHRAVKNDQWKSLLHLMQVGYRFHLFIVETAVFQALKHRKYSFTHRLVTTFHDVHIPWTVLIKAMGAFVDDDDDYMGKVNVLASRLPRCADVDQLRRISQSLRRRSVDGVFQSDKQYALDIVDTILEILCSKNMTG